MFKFGWIRIIITDLADTGGQQVDDPLVRDRHHALAVDLNDPVADPHTASLCYSSPQQTADLKISNLSFQIATNESKVSR